jgi:hypothetical protein
VGRPTHLGSRCRPTPPRGSPRSPCRDAPDPLGWGEVAPGEFAGGGCETVRLEIPDGQAGAAVDGQRVTDGAAAHTSAIERCVGDNGIAEAGAGGDVVDGQDLTEDGRMGGSLPVMNRIGSDDAGCAIRQLCG